MRLVFIGALLLSASAPTLSATNERGGIVEHVSGLRRAEALERASAYCQRLGKQARITATDGLSATLAFECV